MRSSTFGLIPLWMTMDGVPSQGVGWGGDGSICPDTLPCMEWINCIICHPETAKRYWEQEGEMIEVGNWPGVFPYLLCQAAILTASFATGSPVISQLW